VHRDDAPVVHVEPAGVDIEVLPGETLIEAAWRQGYDWPTVCFGQAQCTACVVVVRDGAANLSDIGAEEAATIRQRVATGRRNVDNVRLACRLEVHGPATVDKRGVKSTG
jgi:2Fe-2S ferredoxin